MTNVLITGGAGFIGSHLTDQLPRRGDTCSSSTTSRPRAATAWSARKLTVVEGTVSAMATLSAARLRLFGPEVVVHAAASYKDPEAWAEDSRTNVVGTANVVRAAQARRRHAFRLPPDGALLRPPSAGAADHARPSARPGGIELCDLEDGRRALRPLGGARLDLVPPRQRLRAAQPERAPADVLPAAERRQAVLRHGHTARLRLRRRPRRGGR